ncbi:MAG TPA: hypothetical protein VF173_12285 [Thermoanaerobaculia bacterium]|nr:hypothetical protein [Thermoanaerobaculia bacterium]
MRKLGALLLPPLILVQACATGVPPHPVTVLDPASLAAINHEINDQPVALQLASGEVVQEVEGVVMTPESTSWRGEGDRQRTVPTAEVCKVTRQVRHRAGKGYLWGLLACAPISISVADSHRNDLLGGGFLGAFVEGLCPLIGLLVAAGFKQPPDRVVYSAPGVCGPAR